VAGGKEGEEKGKDALLAFRAEKKYKYLEKGPGSELEGPELVKL